MSFGMHLPDMKAIPMGCEHLPPSSIRPAVGAHIFTGWTPANLPVPPKGWIDAGAMTSAYGDGAAVGAFTDRAGLAWALWSGGSPKMRYAQLNGYPALELNSPADGLNTYGWVSSSIPGAGRFSIIGVIQKTGATLESNFIATHGNTINVNGNFIWGYGGSFSGQAVSSVLHRFNCPTPTIVDKFQTLATGSRKHTGIWGEVNGAPPAGYSYGGSNTPAFDTPLTTRPLYVGVMAESSTYRFRGRIAEWMYFDYGLSATDAQKVTTYLRNKYKHH